MLQSRRSGSIAASARQSDSYGAVPPRRRRPDGGNAHGTDDDDRPHPGEAETCKTTSDHAFRIGTIRNL